MESYELVEHFLPIWERVPKNTLVSGKSGQRHLFAAFVPVDTLLFYLALAVGPQGGIQEIVLVFDPEQPIVADRLLVNITDGGHMGSGVFIMIDHLRGEVSSIPRPERREFALKLCSNAILQFLDHNKGAKSLRPDYLRGLPSTPESVPTRQWIIER